MDHNELFLLTSHDDVPKLTEFRLFLEKEVEEIVMGMQSEMWTWPHPDKYHWRKPRQISTNNNNIG